MGQPAKNLDQEKDTLKKQVRVIQVRYSKLTIQKSNPDSFMRVDTNPDFIHQYNKAYSNKSFRYNLGNLGSPAFPLIFSVSDYTGFDLGLHHFDYLKFKPDEVLYFDTYTPYFDFYYVQGNHETQLFKATMSQNINPFLNISLQYNTINSQGLYYLTSNNHQHTKVKNLAFTTNFHSPDSNYHLYASYIANRFFARENGGVSNDSSFWQSTGVARTSGAFELLKAQQTLLEDRFHLYQYLNLSRKADSNSFRKLSKYQLQLKHEMHFVKNRYAYTDPLLDSSYYTNYFLNSDTTNDTLAYWNLKNAFWLQLNPKSNPVNYFKAGLAIDNGKYHQYKNTKNYSNFHLLGQLHLGLPKFMIDGEADFIYAGNNIGNYFLKSYLSLALAKEIWLQGGIQSSLQAQPFIYNSMNSNHLQWSNSFPSLFVNKVFASLSFNKIHTKINGGIWQINNYVYYDNTIVPVKSPDGLQYVRFDLENKLRAGHFNFLSNLVFQKANDENIISLPAFMLNNTSYFEGKIIRKKMRVQIGFDLRLRSAYYPSNYFAPYSIFYTQRSVKAPLYPYADVFLNAVVEKMVIFVKMEHVNEGYPDMWYFSSPSYPLNPRVFRFGFKWMFFD